MSTLSAVGPRFHFDLRGILIVIVALAFIIAGAWSLSRTRSVGPAEVPLKRCQSCPTCVCPAGLGQVRCSCPR